MLPCPAVALDIMGITCVFSHYWLRLNILCLYERRVAIDAASLWLPESETQSAKTYKRASLRRSFRKPNANIKPKLWLSSNQWHIIQKNQFLETTRGWDLFAKLPENQKSKAQKRIPGNALVRLQHNSQVHEWNSRDWDMLRNCFRAKTSQPS